MQLIHMLFWHSLTIPAGAGSRTRSKQGYLSLDVRLCSRQPAMKISFILLAMLILAFDHGRADDAPKATPYFNPNGDYESIFRLMRPPQVAVRGFDGSPAMDIVFVPSAPNFAPGPLQPALAACARSQDTRWLQVVTIDIPAPKPEGAGHRLFGRERPWSFTDTSTEQRKEGIPFYNSNRDGYFIDNPTYWGPDISTRRRSWVAHLFLVRVEGTSIHAIAGLEWGFGFDDLDILMPKPLRVLSLPDWESYRTDLAKEYPAWHFPERR